MLCYYLYSRGYVSDTGKEGNVMKKNRGKKACGALLSTLAIAMPFAVLFKQDVQAAEECKTYTNYYFYADVASETSFNNTMRGNEINHSTGFANIIPDDATRVASGTVTLTRSGSSMTTSSWSLTNFWDYYNRAFSASNLIYTSGDVNYIGHSDWFVDGGQVSNDHVTFIASSSQLAAASILAGLNAPTVYWGTKGNGEEKLSGVIKRTYNSSSDYGTPDYLYSRDYKSYAMPSLYYIQYKTCTTSADPTPTPSKYKVTKYFKEDGTGKTIRNPEVIGSDYADGATYSTTCPAEIDNYKLVSNANVSGTINGADATVECLYKASGSAGGENVKDNPGTSDIPIYIVWAIGIGALGYSIYYFNKYYKKNNEI